MAFFNFIVPATCKSERLDKFLSRVLPNYSRSFLVKCQLKINSKPAKPSAKVFADAKIEVIVPPLRELKIEAEKIPLQIIFEDSSILIVNKPTGMVVHPTDHGGHVTGTLVNALLARAKNWPGEKLRPGLVHRLDRETSGLLVVAKTELAKKNLTQQFSNRQIEKIYLALVFGKIKNKHGRIEAPIGRDPTDHTKRKISQAADAREAITEFEVMGYFDNTTLVRVKLLTGRTHQIRVHFAALGHPIIGDTRYGFRKKRTTISTSRMFLHATKLGFNHPLTAKHVEFESSLPQDLKKVLTTTERHS